MSTKKQQGAYAAGLSVLAVTVVIVFNLLSARIFGSTSQIDLTGSGIYDISATTTDYMANLSQSVELHILANQDQIDSRIVRFLDQYVRLSDQLSMEYTDPTVYPSVLSTYGVEANTIVVRCEATGLQENIPIDEIIGIDEMSYYYYGTLNETDFDAEGLLTSAIDSVCTGASRMVYETSGHDETAIPDAIRDLFKKAHMGMDSVNLLTDGGIPSDCDLLIINAPTRDLADDERTILLDYLSTGGQVIYCMAAQTDSLPNFESLCAAYGMTVEKGIVADFQRYYQNNPYWIFPIADSNVDASGGAGEDAVILFGFSRGLKLTTPERENVTVNAFLSTSEEGVLMTEEDTVRDSGVYAVGAVAVEEIDDNITARFTVLGSDSLTNADLIGSFSNLDNKDVFLSAATCGFDDITSIQIEPVSLEEPMNTIATGGIWSLLFIFIIPGAALLTGFFRWMRRRKL